MLDYDSKLRKNYQLYQGLLHTIYQKDNHKLEMILNQDCHQDISTYLKTSMKTLRKHSLFINNSFAYSYNNGRIKGMINKEKVLNRVAYGYRNFTNYKNRILLQFKLKPVERKTNKQMKNKTRPKAA
ncbi:transposase [Paraliobacillus sp. JSM ZJ581]|uniref:transposase n=1 Tax=Paraliobacillus sp. JSM ZJ581 TaxID=3342118 RepID=UPI0035A8FB6A